MSEKNIQIDIEEEGIEIEINDNVPDETGVIDEPLMDDPFNPTEINIISKQDTLHNLIERLRHNEIDMNTDFQRHAELWNPQQMSRLIESILIRFPLPGFYFDASNDDKWMSEISPGIRIHANLQIAINTVSLSYAYEQDSEVTADFKPQNVGFGLTFVLPVIVSILSSKPGDMLIIENPEAHLHPGGQTIIGKLCAIATTNGVQLFIETHSDHFLNGVRVAVREGLIKHDQVRLFFLERNKSVSHASDVISPDIDINGRINKWPKGFFDESDRQLEKLL